METIEDQVLNGLMKGLPSSVDQMRLGDVGSKGWNLLQEDLSLPVAILKERALTHNGYWMRQFLRVSGTMLAPHGKTSMSPQLFRRQLEDGAWAITVATPQQMRVARCYGVERIVLANQLVGKQDINYVLDELRANPNLEFYCLVDSVEGVQCLAKAAEVHPAGRPIHVFLECGFVGGRTGCRTLDSAAIVACAVKSANPYLELHGIEGFEGLLQYLPETEAVSRVTDFLSFIVDVARLCDLGDLFASDTVILTAGGSAYFDLVIEVLGQVNLSRKTTIVTRSGCYLTHDSRLYSKLFAQLQQRSENARECSTGLVDALEVWTYVLSVPEAQRAILNAGRRDCGTDAGMPVPFKWFRAGYHKAPETLPPGYELAAISDQHAHMAIPLNSNLQVGDMVALGVSHPCTTFDKWQVLFLVDDAYRVTSAIKTFF